jgi:hypothetical protein
MASSGKKKTTMAKLTRERRLRERRMDKQAKKDARKYAAAHPEEFPEVDETSELAGDDLSGIERPAVDQPADEQPGGEQPAAKSAVQTLTDA